MENQEPPANFTGIWIKHSGAVRTEIEYLDGVPNGIHRSWHENGVCLREAVVVDGQWHGTMIVRRSDGTVLDVSEFEHGTGIYRIFTSDGQLTDEISLRRGKCHGATRYWRRGKLVMTAFYEDDQLNAAISHD